MKNNSFAVPDPVPMEAVVNGLQYRTRAGARIAYHWRPGHATRYYSTARRIHLFITPRGHYFCQEQETEPESSETGPFGWARIQSLSPAEALHLYLEADHKFVPMEDAFPNVEIEA